MNRGFWDKLDKPIMGLAPMANVTDAAFRKIIAHYGKPDVMWTEFVSADGLASAGRDKLLVDFWYEEGQRPIVAQIFGAKPENIYKAAKLVKELDFDGLDINMGCPDRAVLKQGAGGALIKAPELAKEIIPTKIPSPANTGAKPISDLLIGSVFCISTCPSLTPPSLISGNKLISPTPTSKTPAVSKCAIS
jgi:hypothetical protein